MKRIYLTALASCLAVVLLVWVACAGWKPQREPEVLKVGFIYENDESSPDTYNFGLAEEALRQEWGDGIQILAKSNVLETETEEPLRELVRRGCRVVFLNSYSDSAFRVAAEFPDVQFCQVSSETTRDLTLPANCHTFNGEVYQGRYVSGIAAGMKLRALLDEGEITADQAQVGFVGAYPTAGTLSDSAAFLLGVRSAAPEATLRLRCAKAWGNYGAEKACADSLIEEGCIVISQNTSTIAPAVACEEASAAGKRVFHVGFNESLLNVAPATALISMRVNWLPYVTGAVAAVAEGKPIEKRVKGRVHGNDMSAGFDQDWIQMLELNKQIAAEGTEEALASAVEGFRKGRIQVFKGDYTGVNPTDPSDTCDLNQGYQENRDSSLPTFRYILDGVMALES